MHWQLSLVVPQPIQFAADWQLPSDAEILQLIAARNAPRSGQGIVVSVLGPKGSRITAGGTGTCVTWACAVGGLNRISLVRFGDITVQVTDR
jgi:hypothetical protein